MPRLLLFQRLFSTSIIIIVISVLLWGWFYLRRPTTLPFHHVRLVYKVERIDAQQIKQLVWNNVGGGFFSLNVDQLQAALAHQPWIANVAIRREWPDTIALAIQEKRPVARWGATGVLSNKGKIFYPPVASIPADLPTIFASNNNQAKEILSNFQKINEDLKQLGLCIQSLTISDRDAYQLTLSNGISVMVGRDDVQQRFDRFVHFYPKVIGDKGNQVIYVDLRYSDGFAIKWKSKRLIVK